MTRDVAITDVTEMSGNNVCIAGIDLKSGACVRFSNPTPSRHTIQRLALLPGDVLRVDFTPDRRTARPHVEDSRWNRLTARKVRTLGFDDMVNALTSGAVDSVQAAFGAPSMKGNNGNAAWPPGRGARSLATLRIRSIEPYRAHDVLRLRFTDGAGADWEGVPFQDLTVKTHMHDCDRCRREHLRLVAAEFVGSDVLLRIGLTRPFAAAEDAPMCWLQVTNVFARPRAHFV